MWSETNMKYSFILLLLLCGLVSGCHTISTLDSEKISFQAARFDRAVALIYSGGITQAQEEALILGERKMWWSLNNSVNGTPLPPDLAVQTSK
jgi:hypothetical protein